jgi:plasmid maintenance system antidote protein VapI
MSPLAAYFSAHPTRKKVELARAAHVSPGRVTQLCQGDTPSLELALRISEWTGHEVRPDHWPRVARQPSSEQAVA